MIEFFFNNYCFRKGENFFEYLKRKKRVLFLNRWSYFEEIIIYIIYLKKINYMIRRTRKFFKLFY